MDKEVTQDWALTGLWCPWWCPGPHAHYTARVSGCGPSAARHRQGAEPWSCLGSGAPTVPINKEFKVGVGHHPALITSRLEIRDLRLESTWVANFDLQLDSDLEGNDLKLDSDLEDNDLKLEWTWEKMLWVTRDRLVFFYGDFVFDRLRMINNGMAMCWMINNGMAMWQVKNTPLPALWREPRHKLASVSSKQVALASSSI